jgi:putative transposase
MPRTVRVEYEGAVYHVMCRGDRREAIFHDDQDRVRFLETLAEVCGRTGFRIHSYVLMRNHYHLLLETPEPNLVAGMKWLQGTYTQRFNVRHRQVGHLFQGRYKAIPVDGKDAEYFRRVSEYIHLNPARACLLGAAEPRLEAYPWSSYPDFVRRRTLPVWLCRERVFEVHGLTDEGAGSRRRYAAQMHRRVLEVAEAVPGADAGWESLRRGWYLGDTTFRDRLMDRIDFLVQGRQRASYRSDGLRQHDEREAARRLEQGCKALAVDLTELWGRKQTDPIKQAVAWHVKKHSTIGDAWICEKLDMGSRTNVHRAVKRFRVDSDKAIVGLKRKLQLCAD